MSADIKLKVDKQVLNSLPTSLRDTIVEYCKRNRDIAERDSQQAALAYVNTKDEKQRAVALDAQGRLTAYETLYLWFSQY